MRLFQKTKDGGPESPVDAFFVCEFKSLFSIVLLRFNKGGREQYHNHAFHALTWFISGCLVEECVEEADYKYSRSLLPKLTRRDKLHRVKARKTGWCLSLRGPWATYWSEYNDETGITTGLTHGRKVVKEV